MKNIIVTIISKEEKLHDGKRTISTTTSNHWCKLIDETKLSELFQLELQFNSLTNARMHISTDSIEN